MNFKQIDSNTIEVKGTTLTFEQRIAEITDLPDRAIILLNSDDFEIGDPMVSRNVVAISENGQELWRIQDSGIPIDDTKEAFFGILKVENGNALNAVSANYVFALDPSTGAISKPRFRYMGD